VAIGWVNDNTGANIKWWVSQFGDYVMMSATEQRPDPSVPPMAASDIPASTPLNTSQFSLNTSSPSLDTSSPVWASSSSSPTTTYTTTQSAPQNSSTVISNFPAVVTANGSVNVRSGPATTYPLSGSEEISNGTQVQVEGFVYGQDVDGENRWWKDYLGNYIWMGGTNEKVASGIVALQYTSSSGVTTSTQGLASVSGSSSANSASTTSGAPTITISTPTSSVPTSQFPMTVTVNVNELYVRSGPATTYPLSGSQTLHYGDTFTAIGFVDGQDVSGENRWWESQYGNYVWVGGTSTKP
jgi:uncharacterized protein YraI